jgi:hypothetical protein
VAVNTYFIVPFTIVATTILVDVGNLITIALAFFVPLRLFVLRHDNAYQRAYLTFPIVLLFGVGIDLFYVWRLKQWILQQFWIYWWPPSLL